MSIEFRYTAPIRTQAITVT